jgi:MFS superfamily sulfate permease-like transporter
MFFKNWLKDVQASIVVFLVALPLCLGIALASNAPLSSGLYAGIIGGIIIGFASGSNISVSGPAAGLTAISVTAIHNLGSFEAFTLAVFLSGLFQLLFALFKGGGIGDFFPSSVIKGMLSAIGLILILKQIPHAVGFDADFIGDESFTQNGDENTFSFLISAFQYLHLGAVVISFVSLSIMLFWEKLAKKQYKFFQIVPGALIAVVSSILINYLYQIKFPNLLLSGEHLVQLPFAGGLENFVAGFKLPDWSFLSRPIIYATAFTIALVSSIQSLLSVDAADKLDEEARVTNKNRELFAQGLGNVFSGLVGGLPLTAVIVRSSANVTAGGKSKLSAILHGVWLCLCVILIPNVLNLIPLAALASILLLVGYKLTKPELIKQIYKRGINQFIPFVVTIISILFTNLLLGIFIGLIVGFIFVIKSNIHKSIVMIQDCELFLIKFYKDVSFLQKASLQKIFNSIPDGSRVVIDGSASIYIDEDIQDMIEEFIKREQCTGTTIELKKSSLALCPLFKEQ